jgi:hypothetical protein
VRSVESCGGVLTAYLLAVRVYQNGEDVPPYYCRHLLASHKPQCPINAPLKLETIAEGQDRDTLVNSNLAIHINLFALYQNFWYIQSYHSLSLSKAA